MVFGEERRGSRMALRILVAVLALGLAALTVVEGLGWRLAKTNPQLALALDSSDARALAAKGTIALFQEDANPDLSRVRADALSALERDLTEISALRNLGVTYTREDDLEKARAIIQAAHRGSKRDLGVHMWLIEDAARSQDLGKVLDQYDEALRTSQPSWSILPDAMSRALVAPEFVEPLAARVVKEPIWASHILGHISTQTPHLVNAGNLFGSLAEQGYEHDPDHLRALLGRMATANQLEAGFALFNAVIGQSDAAGGFGALDQAERFPPFDWQLGTNAALVTIASGASAIEIEADRNLQQPSANVLLALPPGVYRISLNFVAEGDSAGALTMRLSCTDRSSLLAGAIAEITEEGEFTVSERFALSGACPHQRLELLAQSNTAFRSDLQILLTDVSIARLGASGNGASGAE